MYSSTTKAIGAASIEVTCNSWTNDWFHISDRSKTSSGARGARWVHSTYPWSCTAYLFHHQSNPLHNISHLHELLEGFKLEEFAFCDQLLRITLLRETEKRTVHLGDGEGIQTDPQKTQLVPRKDTDSGFNTTTWRKIPASQFNPLISITFNRPDLC